MTDKILHELLQLSPSNSGMELPPKVFIDMQGEFIEFKKGEKLVAKFPNLERYQNPFGFMQGGMIIAAVDNTVSPLSYVSAGPNITTEIKTTYKRPIKATDHFIQVVATIVEQTETGITLKGDVLISKISLPQFVWLNVLCSETDRHVSPYLLTNKKTDTFRTSAFLFLKTCLIQTNLN